MSASPKITTGGFSLATQALFDEVLDPATGELGFELFNGHNGCKEYFVRGVTFGSKAFEALDDESITEGDILLPGRSMPYGDTPTLVERIRHFLSNYVVFPNEETEIRTIYYILYSWLFDRPGLSVSPFIRLVGTYGVGKSNFVESVGSLLFRAFRGSGSSSLSTIFRTSGLISRGSMVLDEFDLTHNRDGDLDKLDLLREGYAVNGVIRRTGEPIKGIRRIERFPVGGPKLLAGRRGFPDSALESRCFKVILPVGADVSRISPLIDYTKLKQESHAIRCQLLAFRQDHFFRPLRIVPRLRVEPRLMQATYAVLSAVGDDVSIPAFESLAVEISEQMQEDRKASVEGQFLRATLAVWAREPGTGRKRILVKDVSGAVVEKFNNAQLLNASPRPLIPYGSKRACEIIRGLGFQTTKGMHGQLFSFDPAEHATLIEQFSASEPEHMSDAEVRQLLEGGK